jgi:hypothetical protein
MKNMTAFALAALFIAGQVHAQAMRTHIDRKAGFSIQQPMGWKLTRNKDGVNATIATKDNLAMVQVIRADVEAGTTTDAFLQEVERQIGDTHVNQLPEDKRHASPDDLANMNAEEASAGYYDLEHSGQKIHQFIMVIRKATTVYAITVTFADMADQQIKDLAIKIADSVKIL